MASNLEFHPPSVFELNEALIRIPAQLPANASSLSRGPVVNELLFLGREPVLRMKDQILFDRRLSAACLRTNLCQQFNPVLKTALRHGDISNRLRPSSTSRSIIQGPERV